ncbi:hypothetical protein AAFN85_20955 [Mucilaginibacter sp. CAU 1740]|uniref:hypothetical protein n=1 Tax=Mucilaginibacter sp. CAU 1740 TaxID=3140365 RepID=UPI00325AFA22
MLKHPAVNLTFAFAFICILTILSSCKKGNQTPQIDICEGQPVFNWSKVSIVSDGFDRYSNYALAADNMGNVYVAATIQGTVDADPGEAVLNFTGPAVVVQKLNATGKLVWAKRVGIPVQQSKVDTMVLIVDAYRNAYLNVSYGNINRTTKFNEAGDVVNGADFQYGIHTLLAVDNTGAQYQIEYGNMLVKRMGNTYLMNKRLMQGPNNTIITDIQITDRGNIYILGVTDNKEMDFDPGKETHMEFTEPLTDEKFLAFYVQKLDAKGNFLWVKQVGREGVWGKTLHMLVDKNENVYINRYDLSSWQYNFLRRIANDGSFRWEKRVIRNGSVVLDSQSNIYVDGYLQWERYNISGDLTWNTFADAAYKGDQIATADGRSMYSLYPEMEQPFKLNTKVTIHIRRFEFCGR